MRRAICQRQLIFLYCDVEVHSLHYATAYCDVSIVSMAVRFKVKILPSVHTDDLIFIFFYTNDNNAAD